MVEREPSPRARQQWRPLNMYKDDTRMTEPNNPSMAIISLLYVRAAETPTSMCGVCIWLLQLSLDDLHGRCAGTCGSKGRQHSGRCPSRFQSLQQLSAAKLLEFFELRFTQVGEGQSLRRARVCATICGWTMTTTNMAQ